MLQLLCWVFTFLLVPLSIEAEQFADALRAHLQHRIAPGQSGVGIVVAMVDEHSRQIVSTAPVLDGDTTFEIGSITKTFTAVLLQDMVARGDMKLDDPVAKYLPSSVRIPTYNGKHITLLHLATHSSGLPTSSITWTPARADNPRAEYTVARMYQFVSSYKLTRAPGSKYEYSTVGIALLGQAIALKAGTNYESLVIDRICRPLKMDCTRLTLAPEQRFSAVSGHNHFGYAVADSYWGALAPGAALRSTANDLLKYISANLGLTQTPLASTMEQTRRPHFDAALSTDTGVDTKIGLAWMITKSPLKTQIVQHGGFTDGFITFLCFDPTRRRGVVVLSNCQRIDASAIARLSLESDWADQRPVPTESSSLSSDGFVGQYKPRDSASLPEIGVLREGNRLFLHASGPVSSSISLLVSPYGCELLPKTDYEFFERVSGLPLCFSRDGRGKVTELTVRFRGEAFSYQKVSDQPPNAPEPPQPCAAIELDAQRLDRCVGQYEFAANNDYPAAMKLNVWRETDHLLGQVFGQNTLQGAFEICPRSETDFFLKINGVQLSFIQDGTGKSTAVVLHPYRGRTPDRRGNRVSQELTPVSAQKQ